MVWLSLFACADAPVLQWLVAASAGPAATEVAAGFPGGPVAVSWSSSSVLARQVEGGARADLFLSADPVWADALRDRTLDRVDLLTNDLVVVRAPDAPPWQPGAPLTDCVAIGDPDHVPVGVYARAALAEHWDGLAPHVAPVVDAPAAVRAVQAGACPYAIAYATDVAGAGLVVEQRLTGLPIRYPLIRISDDAHALYDWVCGPEAAAVFVQHGFQRLP